MGGKEEALTHILVLSPCRVRIWQSTQVTQELGHVLGCFMQMQVIPAWVRKLWHTHKDMCGNRFSSHAEQLLIFKRKTGQGFKWSLHIMQVSLCKIIYVFVGRGFKSPRPQALWLYPRTDPSLLLSFKALCYPVQFSASS